MDDLYRTGDVCPKTGVWRCHGSEKKEHIIKGDRFGGYHEVIRETDNGVLISALEEKGCEWHYLGPK